MPLRRPSKSLRTTTSRPFAAQIHPSQCNCGAKSYHRQRTNSICYDHPQPPRLAQRLPTYRDSTATATMHIHLESSAAKTKMGYYLGLAWEHYRCHQVWLNDAKSTRVGQTVSFRHKYITAPQFTTSDALLHGSEPKSAETKRVVHLLMQTTPGNRNARRRSSSSSEQRMKQRQFKVCPARSRGKQINRKGTTKLCQHSSKLMTNQQSAVNHR